MTANRLFVKGSRCWRPRPQASRFPPDVGQGTLRFGKPLTSSSSTPELPAPSGACI